MARIYNNIFHSKFLHDIYKLVFFGLKRNHLATLQPTASVRGAFERSLYVIVNWVHVFRPSKNVEQKTEIPNDIVDHIGAHRRC
jgi:hypothetical protein